MASTKEVLVIILDVGKSMAVRPKNSFEEAKKAVGTLVQMKIRYHPKDEVGLVLVGTKGTKNQLNEEYKDEYKNVTVAHPVDTVNLELYRSIEAISAEGANGDVVDGIIVATDMIFNRTKKMKGKHSKRIFIITDAGNDMKTDGLEEVLKTAQDQGIVINVIGQGFNQEEGEEEETKVKKETPAPTKRDKNEGLLRNVCKETGGIVVSVAQAMSSMDTLRPKSVAQRASSMSLEISPLLKIQVSAFSRTMVTRLPTLKKMSKVSEESAEPGKMEVKMERVYHSVDNPDEQVPPEKKIKGYKYGKSIIPYQEADAEVWKLKTDKCLTVLGFTEEDRVPRHHYMSNVISISAQQGNHDAAVALSAFIRALAEMKRVAIVRYVWRDNADPQLGFLAPYIKTDYECLYYCQLPFVEDIRQYPFRSFDKIKHTPEQLQAAEDLINSMDLMSADEDEEGAPMEAMKPKNTFNPAIHYLYQCVADRALHPNSTELPQMDPLIARYCYPEKSEDGFYPKLINKAKDSIKDFADKFPLQKIEKTAEANRKKRKYWMAPDGKETEINLESYENAAIAATEAAGATEKSEQVPPNEILLRATKRMKEGEELTEEEMAALRDKVDLQGIFPKKTSSVGTINPVQDFKDMFARRDEDLVDKAISEMQGVIDNLVRESIKDAFYDKAIDCLVALREGCVKEDEADAFNKYLRSLKHLHAHEGAKRRDFWDRIRVRGISLIHEDECEESKVTAEEARRFLNEEEKEALVEEEPVPVASEQEELFDMLE